MLGSRGDEHLAARFPDEDLLPEFLPQAIELLMHLPLLPTRTVEVGFVPRVRGDEHDDASRRAAPGPTATLDRPDLGGDGLVEDDEVHLRNVEAFFADRRGDDHVHLPGLELLEDLDLFLLRQSDVVPVGGLPDEPDRSEARDAGELLRHPIRRFPIVSEDDHLGVRLLHELVPHDPSRLRELRMFHVGLPRELDRLLHPRVLQELHVRLRLRFGLHLVEVRAEGTEALGLREFHRVVRLHRDRLRGHRAVQPAVAHT